MNIIFEEVNQKIIPALQAAGITFEDIQTVKEQLYKVIYFKLMAKAVSIFSSDEAKILNDKISGALSSEERLIIFCEYSREMPAINQITDEFLKKDFLTVVSNINNLFLKNATPQQKEKLAGLSVDFV